MIIEIDVKPETAALIEKVFKSRGLSLDDVLQNALEHQPNGTIKHFQETATPQEWSEALRSFAAKFASDAPDISDEALRRENIYEREDEML
jgi:hypothetical protein